MMSDEQLLTQFEVPSATYYDGRPNYLFDSQVRLTNRRLIVQGSRGRTQQVMLSDITSVAPSTIMFAAKDVRIAMGPSAMLEIECANREQAVWFCQVMNDAMFGGLSAVGQDVTAGSVTTDTGPAIQPPTMVYSPPPATPEDRTIIFGVLGIIFGWCFPPLGLLFGALSFMQAKRHGKKPTLAYIAFGVSVVFLIVLCAVYTTTY